MSSIFDEALTLKDLDRAGWSRVGVTSPESVAAHSWGVAWLVLSLCPKDLDADLALRFAVIHDFAEVRVGDITPHDGLTQEEKHTRESSAIEAMFKNRPDLRTLWNDYENQATPEARFVRQADRLDMALQALRYAAKHEINPEEFLYSARSVINHPVLTEVLDAAVVRRKG